MALKKMFERLSKPVKQLDHERLFDFVSGHPDAVRIADLQPRQLGTVVGEISSVRIVPRGDGSQWLEATITDTTGTIVGMWTGRRRIAGIKPGQRLSITGRGSPAGAGGRLMLLNPEYELL